MATQSDDDGLHQLHLSQVIARSRAAAAEAGELTPIPSLEDDLVSVNPEAKKPS